MSLNISNYNSLIQTEFMVENLIYNLTVSLRGELDSNLDSNNALLNPDLIKFKKLIIEKQFNVAIKNIPVDKIKNASNEIQYIFYEMVVKSMNFKLLDEFLRQTEIDVNIENDDGRGILYNLAYDSRYNNAVLNLINNYGVDVKMMTFYNPIIGCANIDGNINKSLICSFINMGVDILCINKYNLTLLNNIIISEKKNPSNLLVFLIGRIKSLIGTRYTVDQVRRYFEIQYFGKSLFDLLCINKRYNDIKYIIETFGYDILSSSKIYEIRHGYTKIINVEYSGSGSNIKKSLIMFSKIKMNFDMFYNKLTNSDYFIHVRKYKNDKELLVLIRKLYSIDPENLELVIHASEKCYFNKYEYTYESVLYFYNKIRRVHAGYKITCVAKKYLSRLYEKKELIKNKIDAAVSIQRFWRRRKYMNLMMNNGHILRCGICMEDFDSTSCKLLRNCMHIFHGECLNKWRKNKNNCPYCRMEICFVPFNL